MAMLPASPSWYCSRVCDVNAEEMFVFGAKNLIYIFDVNPTRNPLQRLTELPLSAHDDRVTGLSLCQDSVQTNLCASVGEDCHLKIWNLTSRSACYEAKIFKSIPTCVHWSPVDPNLIVAADDKGEIHALNRELSKSWTLRIETGHVFCISCSPHFAHQLAVGYKSGLVLVVDVRKHGSILQRLRGHDEEVHCVGWCPSLTARLFDRGPGVGPVVISSGRDKTIRFWQNEHQLKSLRLPELSHWQQQRDAGKTRVWLTFCWDAGSQYLYSSGHSGALLRWDTFADGKPKPESFAVNVHNRIIFSICHSGAHSATLITMAMDRLIAIWDPVSMKPKSTVPTVGGFVYCIEFSPVNPAICAIGAGDNLLRVWNTANPTNCYDIKIFWRGIRSKLRSLSWHPQKENWLAYGTEDGRIGIYDVLSAKAPIISSSYHRQPSTVYCIEWGPSLDQDGDGAPCHDLRVFSCSGDGRVLIHNPQKMEEVAGDLDTLICKGAQPDGLKVSTAKRCEICFKPDMSCFALGNADGLVEVFRLPDLRCICRVALTGKVVNALRWHPPFLVDSTRLSRCSCWLACASDHSRVDVVDLSSHLETDEPTVVTSCMAALEGHTHRVIDLCWSIHQEALLVSASFDGTVQVWDVATCRPLANFRGHMKRVFAAKFHPTNREFVMSGSDDFSVQNWNFHELKFQAPPCATDRKKFKKNAKASKLKSMSTEPTKEDDLFLLGCEETNEVLSMLEGRGEGAVREARSKVMVEGHLEGRVEGHDVSRCDAGDGDESTQPPAAFPQSSTRQTLGVQKKLWVAGGEKSKKKRTKSNFPGSSDADNVAKHVIAEHCCQLLAKQAQDGEGEGEAMASTEGSRKDDLGLGFYSANRRSMNGVMREERRYHRRLKNVEQEMMLSIWQGDIEGMLDTATGQGELNDSMMSIACMVSPAKWIALCSLYAEQLESSGEYTKAALYLVSSHRIAEAIDMLSSHHMFRDAIAIAVSRLPRGDDRVTQLYRAWAAKLLADKKFQQAAKCFLAIGDHATAAEMLATSGGDLPSLCAAIRVCISGKLVANAQVIAVKCIPALLASFQWREANQLALSHSCLQLYRPVLLTHWFVVSSLGRIEALQVDNDMLQEKHMKEQLSSLNCYEGEGFLKILSIYQASAAEFEPSFLGFLKTLKQSLQARNEATEALLKACSFLLEAAAHLLASSLDRFFESFSSLLLHGVPLTHLQLHFFSQLIPDDISLFIQSVTSQFPQLSSLTLQRAPDPPAALEFPLRELSAYDRFECLRSQCFLKRTALDEGSAWLAEQLQSCSLERVQNLMRRSMCDEVARAQKLQAALRYVDLALESRAADSSDIERPGTSRDEEWKSRAIWLRYDDALLTVNELNEERAILQNKLAQQSRVAKWPCIFECIDCAVAILCLTNLLGTPEHPLAGNECKSDILNILIPWIGKFSHREDHLKDIAATSSEAEIEVKEVAAVEESRINLDAEILL